MDLLYSFVKLSSNIAWLGKTVTLVNEHFGCWDSLTSTRTNFTCWRQNLKAPFVQRLRNKFALQRCETKKWRKAFTLVLKSVNWCVKKVRKIKREADWISRTGSVRVACPEFSWQSQKGELCWGCGKHAESISANECQDVTEDALFFFFYSFQLFPPTVDSCTETKVQYKHKNNCLRHFWVHWPCFSLSQIDRNMLWSAAGTVWFVFRMATLKLLCGQRLKIDMLIYLYSEAYLKNLTCEFICNIIPEINVRSS